MFMLLAVDPVEGPDQLQVVWDDDADNEWDRPDDDEIREHSMAARRFSLERGGGLFVLAMPEERP